MNNLKPVAMSRNDLQEVLEDIIARVAQGDSFEGNLEYLIPVKDMEQPPEGWGSWPENADFWVTASYRIGNREGQGGMRIIGQVV